MQNHLKKLRLSKEQIANVIDIARKRFEDNYTIMEHKRITTLELLERGYT